MSAPMPMPPEMMGPSGPPGGGPMPTGQAGQGLTPEQEQIVQIALNDPMILQSIIEGLMAQSASGGTPLPPEAVKSLKSIAGRQAPLVDKSAELDKRILGSAKKVK